MADAPKLLGTDTLRQAYPKFNQAIDNANEALGTANTAKNTADTAKSTADTALANSESTQTQLNAVVIDGDSSPQIAQALADTPYTTLREKHEAIDAQLAETVKKSNIHTSADQPSDSVGVDGDLWFVVPALSQHYFIDKFSDTVLNTEYWNTLATSGTPSFSVVNNKMVFDSSLAVTDKGLIVAKKSLPTDKNAKLKFRFIPGEQSRSDGGLVTPVIQRSASAPTAYLNNFFFFTINATTGEVEYRGTTTMKGIPQAITNECEVTVEIDSVNSFVITSCRDVITNKELFYLRESFSGKGIVKGDKLWFTPALDDSTTYSYVYKFTRVEQV